MIKLCRPQLLLLILIGLGCGAPGFADPGPVSVRAGLGIATSQNTAFADKNCEAISPAAYFGCGDGPDAKPRGAYGDISAGRLIEVGIDYQLSDALTFGLDLIHWNGARFKGQANFLNVPVGTEPVSADFSGTTAVFSGQLAPLALLDIDTGPVSPVLSIGLGASRNRLGQSRYLFPELGATAATYVPGGRTTQLAWSAGLGLEITLSERLDLVAGLRYVDHGKVQTEIGDIRVVRDGRDDLLIEVGEIEADLKSEQAFVALRYRL